MDNHRSSLRVAHSSSVRAARCWVLAAAGALALAGCAFHPGATTGPRTTLIDGASGLGNFTRVGGANWSAADGAVQATPDSKEPGYLVSKTSYQDFSMRVEFWASDDANSGVFLRCQDPTKITDENCYEVNIFDQRPDPTFGTGAIVKVAKAPDPMPKAAGRWNLYEITAKGDRLEVVLNGTKTVDVRDTKLASGPIALQWARGTIKFRKLEVQPL